MTRLSSTILTAVLALSTACAGLEPPRSIVIDPRLNVGNMGERSNFEVRYQLAAEVATASQAPQTDAAPRRKAKRPVTPVLFWLGIGLTAVGGVGTVGTAAAGYGTKRQIENSYGGSITAEELARLNTRGEALNKANIAGIVLTVIGATLALTSYGVDYTRCGPLAPKRRRDTAPAGTCSGDDRK